MSNPSSSTSREPRRIQDLLRESDDERDRRNVLVPIFTSDGSDADKENTEKKKKKKKRKTRQNHPAEENPQVDELQENSTVENTEVEVEHEMSDYEKLRLAHKAKQEEMMRQLGIPIIPDDKFTSSDSEPEPQPKRPKNMPEKANEAKKESKRRKNKPETEKETLPRRESLRLKNIKPEISQDDDKESHESFDERILDSVDLDEESKSVFSNLSNAAKYEPDVDINKCSREKFISQILSFRMEKKPKVTDGRITSLLVHPCLSKVLVLAGSKYGTLGVWDPKVDSEVTQFDYQISNINCISASSSDYGKIYSTSHDGTIKMINIETNKLDNIYATDFSDKIKHLTWHDERDANTLLFSHGNGSVGLLDLRTKKVSLWANCYERSCRTVQVNPKDSNLFLTSSGKEYRATIFDIRHVKREAIPICDMRHPKGLTSAFFSHNAEKVLTTCNDDTVKLFNTVGLLERPKQIISVPHNNHTGRWLSVFKAIWYPGRDDAFLIGSLINPRRLQVYGDNGNLLAELKDENMTTISSVISIHPKLPIIAGGNSTGTVHLFWPPEISTAYKNSEETGD